METRNLFDYLPRTLLSICLKIQNARKISHSRLMLRSCQTILGNSINGNESFLTNDLNVNLHRKMNAKEDKADREIEEEMSPFLNFRLNMCFSLCAPGILLSWWLLQTKHEITSSSFLSSCALEEASTIKCWNCMVICL